VANAASLIGPLPVALERSRHFFCRRRLKKILWKPWFMPLPGAPTAQLQSAASPAASFGVARATDAGALRFQHSANVGLSCGGLDLLMQTPI
jgi:hypothetical protein